MNLTPCPPLLSRRGGTQFAALSPLRSPLLLGEGDRGEVQYKNNRGEVHFQPLIGIYNINIESVCKA